MCLLIVQLHIDIKKPSEALKLITYIESQFVSTENATNILTGSADQGGPIHAETEKTEKVQYFGLHRIFTACAFLDRLKNLKIQTIHYLQEACKINILKITYYLLKMTSNVFLNLIFFFVKQQLNVDFIKLSSCVQFFKRMF